MGILCASVHIQVVAGYSAAAVILDFVEVQSYWDACRGYKAGFFGSRWHWWSYNDGREGRKLTFSDSIHSDHTILERVACCYLRQFSWGGCWNIRAIISEEFATSRHVGLVKLKTSNDRASIRAQTPLDIDLGLGLQLHERSLGHTWFRCNSEGISDRENAGSCLSHSSNLVLDVLVNGDARMRESQSVQLCLTDLDPLLLGLAC